MENMGERASPHILFSILSHDHSDSIYCLLHDCAMLCLLQTAVDLLWITY